MIADYRPISIEESVEYNLLFYTDASGGYSFPCDAEGNVKLNNPAAKRNYEEAMAHPERFPYAFNKLEKRFRRYRNPATGVCKCGNRIDLNNDYLGACECPFCGQWWSVYGEELNPVETWKDGDDW